MFDKNKVEEKSIEKAIDTIDKTNFDLYIIDINIPHIDGLEIVKYIRQKDTVTPIIMITASMELENFKTAYQNGCDDYIKKPFYLGELGIKINQILKKEQNNTSHIRFSENYSYSKDKQTLYFNGEPQNLTKKQLEIIHILALNINMIVDFERFRVDVWDAENIDNPTIRAEISRLKKALKEDFIKNIRGLGYKIDRYYSV